MRGLSGLTLVRHGSSEISLINLFIGINMIGRDRDAQIQIRSKYVSKQHAQIIVNEKSEVMLVDRSKRGTFINGKYIHNTFHPLNVNDLIGFGCPAQTEPECFIYRLYRNETVVGGPKAEVDSDAETVDYEDEKEAQVEATPVPQTIDLTDSPSMSPRSDIADQETMAVSGEPTIQPRMNECCVVIPSLQRSGFVPLETNLRTMFGSPAHVMTPEENRYANTQDLERDLTGSQLEVPTVANVAPYQSPQLISIPEWEPAVASTPFTASDPFVRPKVRPIVDPIPSTSKGPRRCMSVQLTPPKPVPKVHRSPSVSQLDKTQAKGTRKGPHCVKCNEEFPTRESKLMHLCADEGPIATSLRDPKPRVKERHFAEIPSSQDSQMDVEPKSGRPKRKPKTYRCSEPGCGFKTKKRSLVRTHKINEHQQEDNGDNRRDPFSGVISMERTPDGDVKCAVCPSTFPTCGGFKKHMLREHRDFLTNAGVNVIPCPRFRCKAAFTCNASVKAHIRTKHEKHKRWMDK